MTITLEHAVAYDIETLPNCITVAAESLNSDARAVWEISQYRDDRHLLRQWFNWLHENQVPMIGFNSEGFDYPVLHVLWNNPQATYAELYAKSQQIIGGGDDDRFAHTIWPRDRFAPQIDLYKLHHFDNKSKRTSLKALQVNMRSASVVESAVPFGVDVAQVDVDTKLIPYNQHDVSETKQFAKYSMGAIEFRLGLVDQFGVECLSWNDTKIGEKMLEQRLGDDVCYDRSSGRKQRRQTPRSRIALRDIIFPYVQFQTPEFQRVHAFMMDQVLTPEDIGDPDAPIKTKGVFTDLHADVGGIRFDFGTGGVHASVENKRFQADAEWMIRDIDVAALYPSIAIVNRLAPAHLGQAFVAEYARLPAERKQHAKGTYMNAALKLAANGAYGKSNSLFSFLYDPQFTLQITINGQLMLCMLAEWLLTVPSVSLISANTDGITYMIRREHLAAAQQIEKQWQDYTQLVLEDAEYQRLWIADVNSYVAEYTDGKLKQKGRYWTTGTAGTYAESISLSSPPAWHKDLSNQVSIRAAVAAMVHGVPPEAFIAAHSDPFDFFLRAKVGRSDTLLLGDREMQRVTRYYVAHHGAPLVKVSPPVAGGVVGQWKRANGVTKAEYERVMRETGGEWDERVCTRNRSKYTERRTTFEAGWNVAECNDAADFSFDNLNREYYVNEARKLIIR